MFNKKLDDWIEILFSKVSSLIETARQRVVSAINLAMVYANYETGKYIIEEEQQGAYRAEYGTAVLKKLSHKLTERFGKGYSVDSLENMRKFFLIYSNSETMSRNLVTKDIALEKAI